MSTIFAVAHMQDIVAIAAPLSLALMLASVLHRSVLPRRLPRELQLLLALIVFLSANILINHSLVGIEPLDFFRDPGRIFYMLFLFSVFLLHGPQDRLEKSLYPGAFYAAVCIAAVSLFSWLGPPVTIGDVRFSGQTRLLGALGGHNPTAGSLGMVLILFTAGVWQRGTGAPFRPRLRHWIGAAVIFVAILLTLSRGYILALLGTLGICYAPVLWRHARLLRVSWRSLVASTVLVACLGTALVMLEDRLGSNMLSDTTVALRLRLFERAWSLGARSPLLGVGLGTFEQHDLVIDDVVPGLFAVKQVGRYSAVPLPMSIDGGLHAHNVFLQLFCEIGLVGIALLVALYGSVLARARRLPDRLAVTTAAADVLATARFNARLTAQLLVYLLLAGMSAGYTLVSPSTSWLLYVAMARLIRQHHWLRLEARPLVYEAPPTGQLEESRAQV